MTTRRGGCSSARQELEVSARVVVSATGTWDQPFWPTYPGAAKFRGPPAARLGVLATPQEFAGQRVAIVGGGNSAAQILAEVSDGRRDHLVSRRRPPRFLPDDVDGRVLFAAATERVRAQQRGASMPASADWATS